MTTLDGVLTDFIECMDEMQKSLENLRASVKKIGAENIQLYIDEENFEKANEIITDLNNFTNLSLKSNIEEIKESAEKIILNQPKSKLSDLSIIREFETSKINKEDNLKPVKVESFVGEIEGLLIERSFKIIETSESQLEIEKNKRHFYLTPDIGGYSKDDYFRILNMKNPLKNIGFVCLDEEIMLEAKKYTEEWAERNKDKCKFLKIHFTNISKLKDSPHEFDNIHF